MALSEQECRRPYVLTEVGMELDEMQTLVFRLVVKIDQNIMKLGARKCLKVHTSDHEQPRVRIHQSISWTS